MIPEEVMYGLMLYSKVPAILLTALSISIVLTVLCLLAIWGGKEGDDDRKMAMRCVPITSIAMILFGVLTLLLPPPSAILLHEYTKYQQIEVDKGTDLELYEYTTACQFKAWNLSIPR